jgi:probable F420-dependent oxidoreductase
VKVRIGIGATGAGLEPGALSALCSSLVEQGFDSIWISDVLTQPGLDPMVAMAWLSGRLPRLKIGATFLIPGWNTLRLARQLAALDQLSDGRLLLVGVPGLSQGSEAAAVGVEPAQRGQVIDEVLPLLKSLLAGHPTDVPGPAGLVESAVLRPSARQQPLDIWLGGLAPKALERCGRIGDGWLPAMISAADAASGRRVIEEVAEDCGRQIDPEHYGVSIGYATSSLPAAMEAGLRRRAKRDWLGDVVPTDLASLRRLLEAYLEVGFSKFVLRPLLPVEDWPAELETLRRAVGDLQT